MNLMQGLIRKHTRNKLLTSPEKQNHRNGQAQKRWTQQREKENREKKEKDLPWLAQAANTTLWTRRFIHRSVFLGALEAGSPRSGCQPRVGRGQGSAQNCPPGWQAEAFSPSPHVRKRSSSGVSSSSYKGRQSHWGGPTLMTS